jgi:uroporphyrinogen-III synthase
VSLSNPGLRGLRVLSLESRRAADMAKLIEGHGGTAVSAPSMREIPLQENKAALDFAGQLLGGRVDIVIFLTGVGARTLFATIETQYTRAQIVDALSRTLTIVRGPKPGAVLRELAVPIAITVPEPNTWRDILTTIDNQQPPIAFQGKSIAVQEYGVSNAEFLDALRKRGAKVTAVPVYQWALPEDLEPLRQACREIAEGRIDVVLITSATQVHYLMQIAAEQKLEERVRRGLSRAVIASIGPIASEALKSHKLSEDFQPSHSKMGQFVFEAAQKAREILAQKRAAQTL